MLVIAPALIVIARLVALDGGPVFYSHQRVGWRGHAFGCLKFRTMRPDADRALAQLLKTCPAAAAEWRAGRKLRADPRVTRLGYWLRRIGLDELPQLFNVLAGDMTLVGPRPVPEDELSGHYGFRAGAYRSVRPGITGL
jgi:exopolysaccharide production protein ExoY